jgi:hypothetical protein
MQQSICSVIIKCIYSPDYDLVAETCYGKVSSSYENTQHLIVRLYEIYIGLFIVSSGDFHSRY